MYLYLPDKINKREMMWALEIENLIKVYKNQITALQGINIKIADGDFYALIGPNAAGKSTLIGIITSLIKKTQGIVRVYGHDLDKEQEQAKYKIGLVPQEFNFNPTEKVLPMLIKQAGFYGIAAKNANQTAYNYLKMLSLWDKKDAEIRHLSGGQKRRLMLARALMHSPRLLVLDEPTSGVDIEVRRFIWQFLKELNEQGITLILTTHYLEEAEQLCKNMAIINHGKVIANYEINNLLQKVDVETIVLHLDKPLLQPFTFKNFNSRFVNPTTVEVYIDKAQTINELFNEIWHNSLNVIRFQNKTNKLEEILLKLTSNRKDN